MNSAPSIRGSLSAYQLLLVFLACAAAPALRAQAVAPPLAPPVSEKDETIVLTPFEVSASSDMGYQATETLAGSRLKTDLKDVATQVNVMTTEFLEDLAITSLEDALLYSLNTETRDESDDVDVDLVDPTLGTQSTINVVGSAQSGRTRGLSAPNHSHDFFDTFVRIDSYNTERFTFANGPNSILFGNSGPAGTVDTTFKRAQPHRQRFEASNRVTSTGSVRFSTDINQPLIKKKLAVRIAGLTDRDKSWRKPAFKNEDRLFATLTYAPVRMASLRVYHENMRTHQQPAKATLIQDHVTPWIEIGKPLYNNHISQTAAQLAAQRAAAVYPGTTTSVFGVRSARPMIQYDHTGFLGIPVQTMNNSVYTEGHDVLLSAPDNFERSIIDKTLFPFNRNMNGNIAQSRTYSWIRGAILDVNPIKNFFVELGINQEEIRNRGIDYIDNRIHELYVDPNMYLNDRVTPNPHVGRYYVEGGINGRPNSAFKQFGTKEQKRASFSYQLDFTNRQGWAKWLGSHQAALLLDRQDSRNIRMRSLANISNFLGNNVYRFNPNAATLSGNTGLQAGFRYYFDPKSNNWTVHLPFDLNADGLVTQPGWQDLNGTPVYIGTFDPNSQNGPVNAARTKIDSTAFVVQSRLLDGRVAASYGRRRDAVVNQTGSAGTAVGTGNFDQVIENVNSSWVTQREKTPVNTIKSVVVHPLPRWLSLHYSESTSEQVRTEVIRNLDGSLAELGVGVGKDYGFTVRWKNRISLRINKYENVAAGAPSGLGKGVPTHPDANLIKSAMARLERSIITVAIKEEGLPLERDVLPESVRSERFLAYQENLVNVTDPNNFIGATMNQRFELLSDGRAKGYELSLTGNPTPNWRVSVTAAKNNSTESNIGGQFWDFIEERIPVWSRAHLPADQQAEFLDSAMEVGNARTYREVLASAAQTWYYIKESDGRPNKRVREYRFVATTRYGFDRGRLKGVFVGANYRWQSPPVIGFEMKTVNDNPFVIPGVTLPTMQVSDNDRPFYGKPSISFDGFFGYSRRIASDRVHWRVQLNIRNVLDRTDLVPQRADSMGVPVVFGVQQPRSLLLTNTFSF